MAEKIIEFKNVSFRYPSDEGEHPLPLAVDDFSLDIYSGEFIAILGRNGSGKSTIAKLANGLLIPESGDVIVDGMNTRNDDDDIKIKQTVGVVFQNPDNQIVATVVEEDVAFGPENLGIDPTEIRQRVDESLKVVGMYKYRLHEPNKLSGGQKQRVAIAGIIAMQPRCIVLDEPTAMLDPEGRRDVMRAIKKMNKELGITVVYITHYMEEACEAERVIVMDKRKLVMDASPREVFSDPGKIKSLGLDVPQTALLAEKLEEEGINLPGESLSVDELVDSIDKLIKEGKN
ncbi:MAG: energy-coupling factor transporter ATPase [Clostridiales bacterium]|nr:energy-coupling factor transporter ATPase [Clostridiales bacterium]